MTRISLSDVHFPDFLHRRRKAGFHTKSLDSEPRQMDSLGKPNDLVYAGIIKSSGRAQLFSVRACTSCARHTSRTSREG
jgi:hypothetical protein